MTADTASDLEVRLIPSQGMSVELRAQIRELCSIAYQEDFTAYLQLLSPAMHFLGWFNGELVTHVAWVERELRVGGLGSLRSAYIEAVATLPAHQGRGFATALLQATPPLVQDFQLAALAPSDAAFYQRLGWRLWEGPLSYTDPSGARIETPEEQVMIYPLPLTPPGLDIRASLSTQWRAIEVW
jgi:GNAT superfamily N-acetyltransferase